jgi:hypothetical protein
MILLLQYLKEALISINSVHVNEEHTELFLLVL